MRISDWSSDVCSSALRKPVGWHILAVRRDTVAGRRLHPAVGGENPECREEGAQRDHQGGEEMQPATDLADAEQPHAATTGLAEKRRTHQIARASCRERLWTNVVV